MKTGDLVRIKYTHRGRRPECVYDFDKDGDVEALILNARFDKSVERMRYYFYFRGRVYWDYQPYYYEDKVHIVKL